MKKREEERPRGSSMMLPILLIALGSLFLLNNIGILPPLNFNVLARLWPLLLIFGGLDIIARSAGRRVGTLLSGLLAIGAVATLGAALLVGDRVPQLQASPVEIQREEITVRGDDATAATIRVDFNAAGADVSELDDSVALLEGVVFHRGTLVLEDEREGDRAIVTLDTREPSFGPLTLFSRGLSGFERSQRWQLGLRSGIPLLLDFDMASGQVDLDLTALTLTELRLDTASGSSDVRLPAGDYPATFDLASGETEVWLPASGRLEVSIDAASGATRLYLPPGLPAEVQVEKGSGGVRLDSRFSLISGERNGDGVWQTEGFQRIGEAYVVVDVDMASGALVVAEP